MNTIIFVIHSSEEGLKSIEYLINDIKANEEAQHALYFKFLMANAYYISKGEKDADGNRHLVGNNEIIFMPSNRLGSAVEKMRDKHIIFQKNCMILSGDGEKAKATRELIINWLLEKEDIKL